ncbi:ATP-binding protein [Streptomyces tateyamensis]|nr:helix-turn-helix domain-containing protein [Streptomyces tateyamensis]
MVREYRLRRGWTQEDLAEESGVSVHAISMLEADRRKPRLSSVNALAQALGLGAAEHAELIAAARGQTARGQAGGGEQPAGRTGEPAAPPQQQAHRPIAQLPPDLPDFTSRADAVAAIRQAFGQGGTAGHTPVFAVTGPGGMGKTSLAVHAAHALRERYPDGQLFADLQGASANPVPPPELVARFLRALGVGPAEVPDTLDERSALYRSLLTDRRILVVLDDVGDGAQVRPVLPASSGCAVLLTSRSRLPELDGVARLELAAFTDQEARELLDRIAEPSALAADATATAELLAHCAGLPLALRITGSRLLTEPGRTVRTLTDRLADAADRLDELRVGDRAVRVSFEASYAQLDAEQARAFRLLGAAPTRSLGQAAATALLGREPVRTERLLVALTSRHLLQRVDQAAPVPRYGFHDLIRLYAQERSGAVDQSGEQRAADERLTLWYLHAARRAGLLLVPHARQTPVPPPPEHLPLPEFPAAEEAMAWCEAERANLVDLVRHTAGWAGDRVCWQLAHSLWPFFTLRRYWTDWAAVTETALDHARRSADREGEGLMLVQWGTLAHAQADYPAAIERYQEAARCLGPQDPAVTAMIEANLGVSYRQLRDFEPAVDHLTRAAEAFRAAGDRYGEAVCLLNLVPAQRILGRHESALAHSRLALAAFEELGSAYGQGHALHAATLVLVELGDLPQARETAEQAVALREAIGDRDGAASSLESLGALHRQLGDRPAAVAAWTRAEAHYEALGSPKAQAVREQLAQAAEE